VVIERLASLLTVMPEPIVTLVPEPLADTPTGPPLKLRTPAVAPLEPSANMTEPAPLEVDCTEMLPPLDTASRTLAVPVEPSTVSWGENKLREVAFVPVPLLTV